MVNKRVNMDTFGGS